MRGDELLVQADVRVAFIFGRAGEADPEAIADRDEGRSGRSGRLSITF